MKKNIVIKIKSKDMDFSKLKMFIKKFDYLSNTVIHLDGRKFARMSIK